MLSNSFINSCLVTFFLSNVGESGRLAEVCLWKPMFSRFSSAPDSCYLYSPTLLDSQELLSQRCKKNYLASPNHSLQLEILLSPVTTILPKLRGSPMDNGDAERTSLAARAAHQDLLLWRKIVSFCQWRSSASGSAAPAAGRRKLFYQRFLGNGQWRMENVIQHLSPRLLGHGTRPKLTFLRIEIRNGDGNGARK